MNTRASFSEGLGTEGWSARNYAVGELLVPEARDIFTVGESIPRLLGKAQVPSNESATREGCVRVNIDRWIFSYVRQIAGSVTVLYQP